MMTKISQRRSGADAGRKTTNADSRELFDEELHAVTGGDSKPKGGDVR